MVKNMRRQEKAIIWPIYFDAAKTRKEGRRVSKSLAVSSPRVSEIKDAAEKLGLECELVMDVAHPKMPWLKTGLLLVKKNEVKEQIIKKIARQLVKIRSTSASKS
jgi:signal recognition particle subunit SRP19